MHGWCRRRYGDGYWTAVSSSTSSWDLEVDSSWYRIFAELMRACHGYFQQILWILARAPKVEPRCSMTKHFWGDIEMFDMFKITEFFSQRQYFPPTSDQRSIYHVNPEDWGWGTCSMPLAWISLVAQLQWRRSTTKGVDLCSLSASAQSPVLPSRIQTNTF